jgi:hypothetical protein
MLNFLLISFGLAMVLPTVVAWLIPAFALVLLGRLFKSEAMKQYGFNLALGLDQLANILLLGDPDETISSRTGRAIASGKAKWWVPKFGALVDWLALHGFGDRDHCARSIESDEPHKYEIWSWIKG